MGGSLRNSIFRDGDPKKAIYRGELPTKRGGLEQFVGLRGGGGLAEKRGGLRRVGDTPMQTITHIALYLAKAIRQ